jgi:hypothetical protein
MAWKNLIGPCAITSRRRVVASALMYGLSLSVRFTSATGEEVEIPAQSVQRANPVISIMARNGAQLPYQDWSLRSAQPIAFREGSRLSSEGCRAACESPMPIASMPGCVSP